MIHYSLEEVQALLNYSYTADNITYIGDLEYVSQHFTNCSTSSFKLADVQPAKIKDFVDNYKFAKSLDESLTIEDFYNNTY